MTGSYEPSAGSFAQGFFATLGMYVAAILLYWWLAYSIPWYRTTDPITLAAIMVFGVAVTIGARQQRKGLIRLGTGYFVGAIVWPLVLLAMFLAVAYATLSRGNFTF